MTYLPLSQPVSMLAAIAVLTMPAVILFSNFIIYRILSILVFLLDRHNITYILYTKKRFKSSAYENGAFTLLLCNAPKKTAAN